MAETSDSFNAQGSTVTSFETIDEGPRAFGVKVHSNDVCGVYGESMEFPPKVGEREAEVVPRTGVFGRGDVIGVEGVGGDIGVEGIGDLVGVFGEPTVPAGLTSSKKSGIGVVARSTHNRAAVFQCDPNNPGSEENADFVETVNSSELVPETSAHIRLVPRPTFRDPQNGAVQILPKNGLAGDFFVVFGGLHNREAIIWFCTRSHDDATGNPGEWGLIQPTTLRVGGQPAIL